MGSAIVIGAGPGIGAAVARRFAAEGLPIGLIARKQSTLDAVSCGLPDAAAFIADVADEDALRTALSACVARLGPPEALIYNAAIIQPDTPGSLSGRAHLEAWSVNVLGALTAATHLAPAMATRGGGSVIITGGMPTPDPSYTSLSLGKAGVRTLVTLLAHHYRPMGIHVATVTVAGPVAPGTPFDPTTIADHYWLLHRQPPSSWQAEIVHTG